MSEIDTNSSLYKKIEDAAEIGNKMPTRQHIRPFPLCMKGLPIFLDEWVNFSIAQPSLSVIATDVLNRLMDNEDEARFPGNTFPFEWKMLNYMWLPPQR
jgi:hypothetical protein